MRLYDLVYHTRTGIVASKSFVFSTSDANEFTTTDTKLVRRTFSRTNASHSHCRRLSTYRCLPPRNASRLRRTKATMEPPQSVFSLHRQRRKTHGSPVWKQFQDEKPLRPQESTLYIPRFFSLTWGRSLKPEAKTKSRNLIGSQTDVKILFGSERTILRSSKIDICSRAAQK